MSLTECLPGTDISLAHFTDIGMPSEQSRDGPWNTNNWAETVFKMFNAIFLDWKHNKRSVLSSFLSSERECESTESIVWLP